MANREEVWLKVSIPYWLGSKLRVAQAAKAAGLPGRFNPLLVGV